MKKRFLSLAVLLIGSAMTLTSCSSDNEPESIESEYYVRYSYKKTGSYQFVREVRTSHGMGVGTYGPLKKGDYTWMSVDNSKVLCIIEISKDNGPFAIKASSKKSASYTIK